MIRIDFMQHENEDEDVDARDILIRISNKNVSQGKT